MVGYVDDDGTLGLYRVSSGVGVAGGKGVGGIGAGGGTGVGGNKEEEGLVRLYDEHEDSAYCVSWAAFTPWIFASVSYNGNLIVNEIPSALKVRILY